MNLTEQKCVPCEGGMPPLSESEAKHFLADVKDWKLEENNTLIRKEYRFKDFAASMKFVNNIAAIAEEQGHHPDISISYNKVTISLTTHAIKGLSVNDFIIAAKIDAILR